MSKKHLTFLITRTSVHVAEVLHSTQEVVRDASYYFSSSLELEIKDELKAFLNNLNWSEEYDEYSLAWFSNNSFLVPMRLFQSSDKKELMKFVVGDKIETSTIDYNRLPELDVVCIYEIPDWVKSIFIIRYPRIAIYHDTTVLLRALSQKPSFQLTINVICYDESITIAMMRHNELKFCNNFEYQSSEDIVYYLLNAIEQLGFKDEKGELLFLNSSEKSRKNVEGCIQVLKKQVQLEYLKIIEGSLFSSLNQLKCA